MTGLLTTKIPFHFMPNFVLYLALFKSLLIQSLETEVATNGSVIQLSFSSSHYDILKFALRVCVVVGAGKERCCAHYSCDSVDLVVYSLLRLGT